MAPLRRLASTALSHARAKEAPLLAEPSPATGNVARRLVVRGAAQNAALSGAALLGVVVLVPTDVGPAARNRQDGVQSPPSASRTTEGVAAPAGELQINDLTRARGSTGLTPRRSEGVTITPRAILLHATGGGRATGASRWQKSDDFLEVFTRRDSNSPVSAHYVIDKDGGISQYVPDDARAWHAGTRAWNSASIGIELINDNSNRDPYSQRQLETLRTLVQTLSHRWKIPADHIYTHRQASASRRDPVGFPFREFLNTLDDTAPMDGRVPGLTRIDQPNERHGNPGDESAGN